MAHCQVPWGADKLEIELPEHWSLVQVASPAMRAAPADWPDRLALALNRPEGAEPLARILARLGKAARIVVVVEDMTRHSPLETILEILCRELAHAGIRDEQVEILVASGMHPAMSAEQLRQKLGPAAERFACRCNDWADAEAHHHVGDVPLPAGRGELAVRVDRRLVEADLRIVITSVSPHLQAGFGGGAKMLVPGCACRETIGQLHWAGLPRRHGQLVGTDVSINVMRQLIDAAGELIERQAGPTFGVQFLLDEADKPSQVVAGRLCQGQRMLAKLCATASGIVVESPADIVIANAAPRDFDLWQSFKGISNTAWAVRENGVIILLARCPGGMNMPTLRWPISATWTRRLIRLLGLRGLAATVRRLLGRIHPEARFFLQLALETIHRNPILTYAPELIRRGERFPALPAYDDLGALFQHADEILGEGSRRVIVFTAGGASYPVR